MKRHIQLGVCSLIALLGCSLTAAAEGPECTITSLQALRVRSAAGVMRVKVQFSEPVRGFSRKDLRVTNATVSDFSSDKDDDDTPSSSFRFSLTGRFKQKQSLTLASVSIPTGTATGTRSRKSIDGCGPFKAEFKKNQKPHTVPTATPSPQPTAQPTAQPTEVPDNDTDDDTPPIIEPTLPPIVPTSEPTLVPTTVPTKQPTTVPTLVPTLRPTTVATTKPSSTPTRLPSATPTKTPTRTPTATKTPTPSPSIKPTLQATVVPTSAPTIVPTTVPTVVATVGTALCGTSAVYAKGAVPVFPDAEGFGAYSLAGSGRHLAQPCTTIYKVTNTKDSGVGSLRSCMEAKGPRVCIFEVSGLIWATKDIRVTNPYLTVAGQTAPSPGIVVKGSTISVEASHVLIQHIRSRPGDDPRKSCCGTNSCSVTDAQFCTNDPGSRDGVKISSTASAVDNVVYDHVSIAWSLDEGLSIVPTAGDINNITFSNSIIAAGLDMSIHPDANTPGDLGHSKGVLMSGEKGVTNFSFHKNLLANNADRNIRIKTPFKGEIVNNVVYNWGRGSGSGRLIELTNTALATHLINLIGNVYKPGLESFCTENEYQANRCFENGADGIDTATERLNMSWMIRVGGGVSGGLSANSRYFIKDNLSNTRASTTADEWAVADKSFYTSSSKTSLVYPANKATSSVAGSTRMQALASSVVVDEVLARAGARPADRDIVDARAVDNVRSGTGRIINCVSDDGSERCSKNAGGWPYYPLNTRTLTPPANINSDDNGNGYTNLEDWLFSFSQEVERVQ